MKEENIPMTLTPELKENVNRVLGEINTAMEDGEIAVLPCPRTGNKDIVDILMITTPEIDEKTNSVAYMPLCRLFINNLEAMKDYKLPNSYNPGDKNLYYNDEFVEEDDYPYELD